MRITGWHISGFGMFADSRVDDLSPGLTVLYGPNEAGKSTLVAYLLSILFGFTTGKSKGPQYEPLAGGNHGGRLFLRADDGDYVIERTKNKKGRAPTVWRPDGETGAQEAVKELVGGADRALFRNVFAFSLHELEEIRALEDDSVRERIFATPTFGGGPSAREVVKALNSRESELLRPRASSTISDLRRELEAAATDLRRQQAEAKSYPRAVAELAEANEEVESISVALGAERREVTRFKTLIDVWPHWSARSVSTNELRSIEVPAGVELASENRLNDAERQIDQAKVVVREREGDLERQQSRLNRISVDDRLPPIAADAKRLQADVARFDADRTRLANLDVSIGNLGAALSQSLADLGPAWSKERVEAFDVSIPAKGELSKWRDEISEAEDAVGRVTAQVTDLGERLNEASGDRGSSEEKLRAYAATPSSGEINTADAETRRLRVMDTKLVELRARVSATDERAAAVREAVDRVGRAKPVRVPPGVLLGIPAILAILGVVAGIAGELVSAVLLLVLAVVSGAGLAWWKRTTGRGANGEVDSTLVEKSPLADEARRELSDTEDAARDLAVSLGFDGIPTNLEIEDRLAEISRQRADRSAADALRDLVEQAREKEHRLEEKLETHRADLEEHRSTVQDIEKQWDTWRSERGIPEPTKPELVMELLPAITRARELIKQEYAALAEAEKIRKRIEEFERSATGSLRTAERDDDVSDAALMAAVETLHRDVLTDENERKSAEGLTKGIGGARKSLEQAETEMKEAESARERVLAEAGVIDAAALTKALERLKRRSELEAKAADLSLIIEAATGGGSGGEAMREELGSGDLGMWQANQGSAEERVDQIQAERDEALRRHQDQKTATAAIAGSSDVAQQALTVEACRADLAEAIIEWARVATARALIEETLARFERKHQPKVVERAAHLFGRITAGRYPELMSSEDALTVISRSGDHIDVVDLSTGTVQQLYLCLRFALAEEFAERGTRMPLVMDDVLVNFDPERAAGVASVISDVSDRHQVLLLTCHPETRDLMAAASPDSRIIDLERFAR